MELPLAAFAPNGYVGRRGCHGVEKFEALARKFGLFIHSLADSKTIDVKVTYGKQLSVRLLAYRTLARVPSPRFGFS